MSEDKIIFSEFCFSGEKVGEIYTTNSDKLIALLENGDLSIEPSYLIKEDGTIKITELSFVPKTMTNPDEFSYNHEAWSDRKAKMIAEGRAVFIPPSKK